MPRHRKTAIRVKTVSDPKRWGFVHPEEKDKVIYLDTTAIGLKRMEIIIHEALHILYPEATEKQVEAHAVCLATTLWNEDYRFVDNQNLQKLQV